MTRSFNQLVIQNLVSPYGLAAVSYVIFLFAWAFPPGVYTQYLVEPDLMFLDPLTLVFYTACVAAFLFGTRAFRFFAPATAGQQTRKSYRSPSILYYVVPLLLGTMLDCIRLIKLGGHVDFVSLIASQQGATLKQVLHSGTLEDAQWSLTLMVLTGTLWWALFRSKQFQLRGADRFVFLACFSVALIVDIGTCIASLDRTSLMPLIAGLAIIMLYGNFGGKAVRLSKLVSIAGAFATGLIGMFLALAVARGTSAADRLVTSLLGYTIASYNRLTALLTGVMNYEYGGKGVYLFPYITDSSSFNTLTGIADKLAWPSSSQLWNSEFASTLESGLNGLYIWSGTFGYLYADLGWFALVYLFGVGLLAGYLWAKFKLGKTLGLVLYPWMAFCILFWLGWNPLFGGYFMTFLLTAIALAIYDFVLLGNAEEQVATPQNYAPESGVIGHPQQAR